MMSTKFYTIHLGFVLIFNLFFSLELSAQESFPVHKKGKLLYENTMVSKSEISNWIMEGPAELKFHDDWMHMYSPDEKGHHVFWCPEDFPKSFIAEWELQNIETDAGLCIVFFSSLGKDGKDIFDPTIKARDGVFRKYTQSDINCYHISYYANGKDKPGRVISHLRKNAGFHKVQVGKAGIPEKSKEIHKVQLIKNGDRIIMKIDEREIINWLDDGEQYGAVLGKGKIGLRQMKWTHFRYRNFKVWSLAQ